MRSSQKTLALWAFLLVLTIIVVQAWQRRPQSNAQKFENPEFWTAVRAGDVASVTLTPPADGGNVGGISGEIKPEKEKEYGRRNFTFTGSIGDETSKRLREAGIEPRWNPPENAGLLQSFLFNWLPLLFVFFLMMFLVRQLQVGGGKAMSFGKSRARLLTENKNRVTFRDVAGMDESKEELEEIIQFLKDPKKYTKLGGRIPKGVLLIGPPGTGKTLLARAVAGEAGVPFFSLSGSDFVEMFVGVGASRVRDLFEQGKKNAPCLIFIDEIDAVGRQRGAGLGGGHDEREQTLNQLLVEMDGFEGNDGVILIAATNRPDVLDPALLRPGRFDRRVVVNKPDVKGRLEILKVHTRRVPLATEVDLERIARGTPGFSGADLENLVNEAALYAARKNKKKVDSSDLEIAKDKVLMGTERKSMVISEEDKRITAYHEAGHTLVGKNLPGLDPIHKVTIIPRGMALGVTQTLPERETLNLTKNKAYNLIAFLFGGRAAEELIFKDFTTGAGNDIERATELARRMVCEWGMSEKMGPLAYEKRDAPPFLGMAPVNSRDYSDRKAEEIDAEVQRIIRESYDTAVRILREKEQVLHALARALLEKESLDGQEVDIICNGGNLEDIDRGRRTREQAIAKENQEVEDAEKEKGPIGDPDPVTA